MNLDYSLNLYNIAKGMFPGGVNSPVRAAVKPYPFYVSRGYGAILETLEGTRLIDYVLGYGPLILGHCHDVVLKKVLDQLMNGWLYGVPHESEILLGKKIKLYYGYDYLRFVNSGTEGTITAIRIARGYTNRDYIVKFEGCYHGSNDSLLVKSGSAVSHYGVVSSKGVPRQLGKLTFVLDYNDSHMFESFMGDFGDKVAAVIVEPIIANAGLILPNDDFLKVLREETEKYGTVLIFDEVVTGFRIGLGGAVKLYGIHPDLVTLGKIIGGGFPIGAVIGSSDLMEELTPLGKVFNAGTFNAHPIAMVAGLATIEEIEKGYVYKEANKAAQKLADGLIEISDRYGIASCVNHISSMFQIFFTNKVVKNYRDALSSDKESYFNFHARLLKKGVFIPPSQFETCFTSSSHSESIVDDTISKFEEVFRVMKKGDI